MIALLIFFMTIAAFGASSVPLNPHCTSLVLRAGLLEPLSDLSPETATNKYIQYVRHFISDGSIGLEELKILRGFSAVQNIADVFSEKISESYVYRESIQELLPFINLSLFHEFLDELIKEKIKELNLKQTATNETEEVPLTFGEVHYGLQVGWDPKFYKPMYFSRRIVNFAAFQALPSDDLSQRFLMKIDSLQGPLLISGEINAAMNLRTKKKTIYEDVVGNPHHGMGWYWIEFKNEYYIGRYDHFADRAMVHNANTGAKLLEFRPDQINFKDSQFRIFAGENGEAHLAAVSTPTRGVHEIFISSNGSQKAQVSLLPTLERFQWVSTAQGELYAAYTYKKDGKELLAFTDISKFAKSGWLHRIQIQGDEKLVGFTENNKGGFTAVLKSRVHRDMRLRTIDFQQNAGRWENAQPVNYEVIFDVVDADLKYQHYAYGDPVILRDTKGELFFLVNCVESSPPHVPPSYIFKHNEKEPKPAGFMPSLESPSILARSDGSQVLVGQAAKNPYDFFIFDVQEGQARKIHVGEHESSLKEREFAGVGLSDKDEVFLYFGPKRGVLSYDLLTPVQITGTFKPGEVK
jgi:hypothetical protein